MLLLSPCHLEFHSLLCHVTPQSFSQAKELWLADLDELEQKLLVHCARVDKEIASFAVTTRKAQAAHVARDSASAAAAAAAAASPKATKSAKAKVGKTSVKGPLRTL